MTGLSRTPLTTSQKIECAASAVSRQREHGAVTALSREYGISRPTVYAVQASTEQLLERHFEAWASGTGSVQVRVDEAQLRRALVALRVMAPNSIRAIEDLVPVLYPGVKVSYGKIQALLCEAEASAAQFNAQVPLSGVEAGALDEMFSQGAPVLAGVGLDEGYLFALSLNERRDGATWAKVLEAGRSQGLELSVVVKDAARGIEAGVREVFPQAEQRDDCFHALYEMNKVRRRLERQAYAAVQREVDEQEKLRRIRAHEQERRRSQRHKLVWAKRECEEALSRHDTFERAMRQAHEAMECVDLASGELRSAEEVRALIEEAADTMCTLDDRDSRRVGTYVRNRAPGLALAMGELRPKLDVLAQSFPAHAVALACVMHRLLGTRGRHAGSARRRDQGRRLLRAWGLLQYLLGRRATELLESVGALLEKHHRASSAIEGFNAALRPFLYVHKGVTQGFLDLFRAYFNLRTRRWGRHKGTTAHECLTAQPVGDWLTLLGYPPSPIPH